MSRGTQCRHPREKPALECFNRGRGWQDWADPILQKPYEIKDGRLHIPNVPGIGLEWNEDAVKANQSGL
jgi:L-alanine-DL-glutamate epimerase-like enolase superfamily enzyme